MIKTKAVVKAASNRPSYASDALQEQLNGFNLHEAITKGLITNDADTAFGYNTTTRESDNTTWNRLVLKAGGISFPVSQALQAKLEEGGIQVTEELISSLEFSKGISRPEDGSHPYFVLKMPSSGLTRSFAAVELGELVSA